MTINNEINIFKADYNYGPVQERPVQRYYLTNLFDNLTAKAYKKFIYPGAAKKFDKDRLSLSKNQLKAIGGKVVSMKTPDGELLDGMYLKARDFKTSLEKYLSLVSITKTSENSEELLFTLKPEFCTKEESMFFPSCTYKPCDQEAINFLEHVQSLEFGELTMDGPLPEIKENESRSGRIYNYLRSFIYSKVRGVNFRLHCLPKQIEELRSLNEEIVSNPTVLISGGNGGLYIFYKSLAALYLIRGLDVMLADFRGYGDSTGTPTAYNTKLDLETVYQFLSKEQGVKNEDILLHGHCLGAGSATDLAARRKGINILVDRSFSNIRHLTKEVISEMVEEFNIFSEKNSGRIGTVASHFLCQSVHYDNASNLSRVEGKIVLIRATNDDVISEDDFTKLVETPKEKTIIYTDRGHNDYWIYSGNRLNNKHAEKSTFKTSEEFNQFLIEANLYRKVFDLFPIETSAVA